MARSTGNAFDWRGQPSILTSGRRDPLFNPTKDGRTRSQVASGTVKRRTQATGVSPGQIWGLSEKADKQLVVRPKRQRRA